MFNWTWDQEERKAVGTQRVFAYIIRKRNPQYIEMLIKGKSVFQMDGSPLSPALQVKARRQGRRLMTGSLSQAQLTSVIFHLYGLLDLTRLCRSVPVSMDMLYNKKQADSCRVKSTLSGKVCDGDTEHLLLEQPPQKTYLSPTPQP